MCGVWPKKCVFFCVTFQWGLLSIVFEVLFGCAACGLICCGDSRGGVSLFLMAVRRLLRPLFAWLAQTGENKKCGCASLVIVMSNHR